TYRVDKTTLAALEATLLAYLEGREADLPLWSMALAEASEIERRAGALRVALGDVAAKVELAEGFSTTGGGSAPGCRIPTVLLEIAPRAPARPLSSGSSSGRAHGKTPADLRRALVDADPPVIARVEEDRLVLDLPTVAPQQDVLVAEALRRLLTRASSPPSPFPQSFLVHSLFPEDSQRTEKALPKGQDSGARHRHGGARRPREKRPRPGADGHRPRPAGGGEAARPHDRPRVRLARAPLGTRGGHRGRPRPRAVHQEHAGGCRRHQRDAVRRRRQRGLEAPVPGAPRHPRSPRRLLGRRGRHQGGPGRPLHPRRRDGGRRG